MFPMREGNFFAKKSTPKPKEEMQPKINKNEFEYRNESNDYVIFAPFSLR